MEKEITIVELLSKFPDDMTAMRWFESNIWKDGRKCPHCGSKKTETTKHSTMPYRCKVCYKRFSVKVGTVMTASNIGYRKWAIATYMFAKNPKGISSVRLGKDLGITQKSAWFMVHRLRELWKL